MDSHYPPDFGVYFQQFPPRYDLSRANHRVVVIHERALDTPRTYEPNAAHHTVHNSIARSSCPSELRNSQSNLLLIFNNFHLVMSFPARTIECPGHPTHVSPWFDREKGSCPEILTTRSMDSHYRPGFGVDFQQFPPRYELSRANHRVVVIQCHVHERALGTPRT